jgi:hypothetical protein
MKILVFNERNNNGKSNKTTRKSDKNLMDQMEVF